MKNKTIKKSDTPDTPDTPKTRSRSDEKREAILDAAAGLFTQHGFVKTSMDQIAQHADVSKQTVYSHFGDKQGVFIAAIQRKCIADSLCEDLFTQPIAIDVLLLELARHFNDLLLSHESVCLSRLCFAGAEEHPEVSKMFYQAGPEHLTDLLQGYFEKQVALGILVIDNLQFASWQFLHMINGDAPFRAKLGLEQQLSAAQLDDYLKSCVNLFLRAYKA
ncbi:MAG: TetR/AcrR family transcriptional regulator [Pseudomonadales bacterium]|nr:TetR/AcrR family transcriptional regulator [Pseudomonadales bacterium]